MHHFIPLLLPATRRDQAHATVERVRLALKSDPVRLADGPLTVAISAGITGVSDDDDTLDALLRRADRALYEAKGGGRDRTVVDGRPDAVAAAAGAETATAPD